MSVSPLTQCAFARVHTRCPVERGRSIAFKAGKNLAGSTFSIRRHHYGNSANRMHKLKIVAEGAIKEGELVSSEEEFLQKVTQHEGPIVVDWMAKWCRKCIYLKPKLEKMLNEDFPGLDLVFIDVNSIPGSLVYGHGIQKMPTITIHKAGKKQREHIAAEPAPKAIANIRTMVKDYMELNPEEKKMALNK